LSQGKVIQILRRELPARAKGSGQGSRLADSNRQERGKERDLLLCEPTPHLFPENLRGVFVTRRQWSPIVLRGRGKEGLIVGRDGRGEPLNAGVSGGEGVSAAMGEGKGLRKKTTSMKIMRGGAG